MNDVDETDTEQLIQRASDGDVDAVDQLFERHRRRLRGMVEVRIDPRMGRRVDPSDVVQETLVVAHIRLNGTAESVFGGLKFDNPATLQGNRPVMGEP